MRPGMQEEIWRVIFILVSCALFGWSLGFLVELIFLGILGYCLWTFSVAGRVFAWIDKGMRGIPPELDGIWGDITDTFNRQRRRHRRAQDKMRVTINRVTRVTEVLDEGLLILTNDRNLDWWNSSAKRLLGLRSGDRGTSVMNLIRDPDFVAYINQGDFSDSLTLASNVQDTVVLELTASYFGQQGEIVLLVSDTSRINHLQKLRSEFVGNVSHELRTPLTVIKGYLETLQDTSDITVLQQKAFQQMSEQVIRMQSLADDLILLSRLEESHDIDTDEKFDITALLHSLIGEAKALSSGQHSVIFEHTPLMIWSSEKDIRGALGNVIFNAVRHNPQGAVISIAVREELTGILISIKDDGIGIDPYEIPRLTERFYRGDNSRNSHTGGSGLGLAITKHALSKAGGNLSISSRVGQGASFDCWLPYHSKNSAL